MKCHDNLTARGVLDNRGKMNLMCTWVGALVMHAHALMTKMMMLLLLLMMTMIKTTIVCQGGRQRGRATTMIMIVDCGDDNDEFLMISSLECGSWPGADDGDQIPMHFSVLHMEEGSKAPDKPSACSDRVVSCIWCLYDACEMSFSKLRKQVNNGTASEYWTRSLCFELWE